MTSKKHSRNVIRSAIAVVVVMISGLAYLAVSALIDEGAPTRQRQIQTITLVKPPPPQPPKEKIPEPEVQKKEEIVEQEQKPPPEENNQNQNEPPPGEDLGVDAEGSGSGDSFGLVGRRGGRSLVGSGGDKALMQRYAWYTRMIQDEIRKRVNDHLSKNGGLPDGDHKALIKIVLDEGGRIVDFQLFGSSGDPRIDKALEETLKIVRINEAPPEGMPRALRLKVSSRG